MRVLRAGPRALLIECAADRVEAWRSTLWQRREQGQLAADEIVPGERTVLLDGVSPEVVDLLPSWEPGSSSPVAGGRLVEIPTTFEGPDLSFVASHWGISVSAAVARLVATEFSVAFCGFAPGFAYMRGLADAWAVPRLAAPRPRVPAGAVALAGAYAGIYPAASPGGWRLVGQTDQKLFSVRDEPPALLSPGTRVRLTEVR
jgi:KipI family sensor histidine kinase inhibitor